MRYTVPQRMFWPGQAERLSPAWTMTKDAKTAECVVWSHQFGFELRLTIGVELVQSQVCQSQEQLIEVQEAWLNALAAKGWTRWSGA